jgi:Rrf2 family protein
MLLTKTTELAIQCLVFMAAQPAGVLTNPATIAEKCSESETYIAKVMRTLAKAGMLRSHRGITGGYETARPADSITLLDVVEACQGTIPGNYCQEVVSQELSNTCGYHQAMKQLHKSVVEVLSEWTIARVASAPRPSAGTAPRCRLNRLHSSMTPAQ